MVDQKRIILSNTFWKFRFISEDEKIPENVYSDGLPNDEETLKVYVPSTWSYYQNRKNFYHFGQGLYEMTFYIPYAWGSGDGKKITLVFNGSNYKTSVWLNGKKVGFHEGGYTKFWFTINKFVTFGSENKLIIQVDNRYGIKNSIPWFKPPEWMNYGGIFRPVYLKLGSRVGIDNINITNDIECDNPIGSGSENCRTKLNINCNIKDSRPHGRNFEGSLIISIKNSEDLQTVEVPFKFEKSKEEILRTTINIENPHLWSIEKPFLHNISFQLIDKQNRRELDRETLNWGIRSFKIIGKDFYLNNKRIVLRGINRHDDHPDVGSSLNPRLIYNDLNIMKECSINCIRTSHYPPHESLLDMADEMGFLVLEEIPVFRMDNEQYNPETLMNAQQQLWEMIHRDKNHCSVIAWIVSSECDTSSPKGREFMKNLIEISRDLDPSRLHTLVTDKPLNDTTFDLVDFICVNFYYGWYDKYNINPNVVSKAFTDIWEKIAKLEKVKPFVISEFGAGAITGFKDFANARWSETYQYDLLRTYLNLVIEKKFISGTFISFFQDFRCSPYNGFLEHPKEYNNKGIVDMHRAPKIGYYIVQSRYKKWKKLIEEGKL